MRHRQVIALAAVGLVGLAGCADRPNDLDTYYDDPAPAPSSAPVTPAAPVAPAPAPVQPVANPELALLTDGDVAPEGVRRVSDPAGAATGGCLSGLPATTAAPGPSARWRYPSGSRLEQQVSGVPDRDAGTALTEVRCGGTELDLSAPLSGAPHRAWCEGPTCTVVLAGEHVLSAIEVTASSASRAAEAATRLAPVAAARLRGQA